MSAYSAIDLSQVPAPDLVESLSFESILDAMKSALADRLGERSWDMESEPLTKLLEVCAYRELLMRQRVNDAARQTMLAYATGSNLDNLAALIGVKRQDGEEDDRLRTRTQLGLEGFSTAGPEGAYVYHAMSADKRVKDIEVTSPSPGEVLVTVLSTEGKGVPDAELINIVEQYLSNEDVRPLTDYVRVEPPEIMEYQIDATLIFYPGPDAETIRQAAESSAQEYAKKHHALDHDITLSGLYAALHQPGVQKVILTEPISDIVCSPHQAAWCIGVNVIAGGSDE